MNFSKLIVAALSFNYSPWFVQGEDLPKVGQWELHPIGNDSESPTFGVITTDDDSITVVLTVEGSFPTRDDHPMIEVFTGVADGEACAEGTKIAEGDKGLSSDFTVASNYESYLALRVTSDGSIGKAQFSMNLHDSSVWREVNGDFPNIGTFDACARVAKKHEDTYVSFVDTSIKVIIDGEGKFQTFEKAITVVGTSMKSLEENQKRTIELDSYLCGPSDSADPDRTYKIGQSFSICVGPTEDAIAEFGRVAVVGFEEVTCGEIDVVENGQETALTTVTTDPRNYMTSGGDSVGAGVSSFETVVTPEYYTGVSSPNEASITCSGTVELRFKKPTYYPKVGCVYHNDLTSKVMFYVTDGGTEAEVKICNDSCRNRGKKYFTLMCAEEVSIGDNIVHKYTCGCIDELETELETTDGTCSGEDPYSAQPVKRCLPDRTKDSNYDFGYMGRDKNWDWLLSPTYKVEDEDSGRRLTASFSTNSGNPLQRHLQESGNQEDTRGSFGTKVLLSGEDNVDAVFGNLAAPAADTGAVPSTAMATAAGAVVVATAASLV